MPLNILAWNNKIGPWYYFVGLCTEVMIVLGADRLLGVSMGFPKGGSIVLIVSDFLPIPTYNLVQKHPTPP